MHKIEYSNKRLRVNSLDSELEIIYWIKVKHFMASSQFFLVPIMRVNCVNTLHEIKMHFHLEKFHTFMNKNLLQLMQIFVASPLELFVDMIITKTFFIHKAFISLSTVIHFNSYHLKPSGLFFSKELLWYFFLPLLFHNVYSTWAIKRPRQSWNWNINKRKRVK